MEISKDYIMQRIDDPEYIVRCLVKVTEGTELTIVEIIRLPNGSLAFVAIGEPPRIIDETLIDALIENENPWRFYKSEEIVDGNVDEEQDTLEESHC